MNLKLLNRQAVTSSDLSAKLTTLSVGDMRRISGGAGGINYVGSANLYAALYNPGLLGATPFKVAQVYSALFEGTPSTNTLKVEATATGYTLG